MSSIGETHSIRLTESAPIGAASDTHSPGTADSELVPDAPPQPPAATSESNDSEPKPHKPRGFAAIDRSLLTEIARKGGKAAHSAGTAHEFTSDEARAAGRKGGLASHARRRKTSSSSP